MAQTNSADASPFQNPLDGLNKTQTRQLASTVRRIATINQSLEKARKTLADSRFTVKANYSAKESAKAVTAARAAERAQEKAAADLEKIKDKFRENAPMKAALGAYQDLEKAAQGGDPAARSLLDDVNVELTFAAPPTASRAVKATATSAGKAAVKAAVAEELLNGIGAGRVAKKEDRVGELTEHARSQATDVLEAVKKRREPNEFLDRVRDPYPPSLLARFSVRGKEVVDKRTDAVAFVDAGKELRAKGDVGRDVIDAMLDTADSRGWAPIKVFGTQAFKAAVWMEAASRGMEVTGYKPSKEELAAAEQNRQLNGKVNAIAGTSTAAKAAIGDPRVQGMLKAFQEAGTGRQQASAAKQFPELSNAFALVGTFEKAIARPGMSKTDSQGFVEQFKDLVAERLQHGKPLPTVTVAEHVQQKGQLELDQER